MSLIITIGRQFGSGGRDVGEKVAEYFNIPFYDKELVELAAQKSNISKEALKEVDEHATNSFLYSLASGNYVIKEVAKRGSCVIVGRCADYVLENENVDVLSVFVYGSVDYRAKRVMSALDITQAKAKDKVLKTDKQRRTYYDYYTSKNWGVMSNYDLCIDAEKFGIEETANMIINAAKKKIK